MDSDRARPLRILLTLASLVVICAGLKAAASLVSLVLLALFLGVLTTPVFLYLRRYLTTGPALAIMLVGLSALGMGLGMVVMQSLQNLHRSLGLNTTVSAPMDDSRPSAPPEPTAQAAWSGDDVSLPVEASDEADEADEADREEDDLSWDVRDDADQTGLEDGDEVPASGEGDLDEKIGGLKQQMRELGLRLESWGLEGAGTMVPELINQAAITKAITDQLGPLLRATTGMLGQGFLVLLILVFIWIEAMVLPGKLAIFSPANRERAVLIGHDIRTYSVLKTWMSLLTAVLVLLLCWLMDVRFPLVLALLAFVLNYVPTVGSIIAAVPALALALLDHGLGHSALVGVGYLVINIGISNGLEPRFMGRGLGLSPLVVVLSMVGWGWILGPIGMLLALPLTMVVKVGLDAAESTRHMAVLLGASGPLPPEHQTGMLRRSTVTMSENEDTDGPPS